MVIILDADVIIRGEKGVFDLGGWVASLPNDQFEIAAITIAELWHGVERAVEPQKSKRRKYLETMVAALLILFPTPSKPLMNMRASGRNCSRLAK